MRRYGYASVNFGLPLSAKEFSSVNDIDFRRLEKPDRFVYVEKLAGELLNEIKHVMPVLPVPLITTVFEQNPEESLRSIDVIEKVNQLIANLMSGGSAMSQDEKPKQSTISQSLTLLSDRGILKEEKDRFRLNDTARQLVQYYSNSIRHFNQRHDSSD